jgi:type IV secretion system protein VirB9
MLKKPLVAAILAGLTSVPALAEEVPAPGTYDARLRVVDYNPNQVFKLRGSFRNAMEIVFENGEEVVNIAVGDAVSWEVAPSENFIFVKPREAAGPTNMIVTTTMGSETRIYHFDLSIIGSGQSEQSGVHFGVRFRYPEAEARREALARLRAQEQQALAVEAAAVELALDSALVIGPRNLDYRISGSQAIAPSEVSDNGTATVLRFPRNQAVPAIFEVLPDGSEAAVPYTVSGEFVIINKLVRQIRLRSGEALACIWNMAPPDYGNDLGTGTISPEVIREVGEGGQ